MAASQKGNRERHRNQMPADKAASTDRPDDRYGHFRNLAARCSTPAVPSMRARAPMEAGGRLGGPRANGFNEQILGADKQVPGRAQGKRREDVAEITSPATSSVR